MGPLVYTSGSPTAPCAVCRARYPSFNGAAGLHQRKQPVEDAAPGVGRASMGPLVYTSGSFRDIVENRDELEVLQWGRWFTPAEAFPDTEITRRALEASMGPLVYTSGSWVGGNELSARQKLQWGRWFTPAEAETVTPNRAGPHSCFNGAAGLHQRKPLAKSSGQVAYSPLQWGRWFTPAEARHDGVCPHFWPTASMGPLVYTSGSRPPCSGPCGGCSSFNGAAGLHQRKLWLARVVRGQDEAMLQWGRWFTPAEAYRCPVCLTTMTTASMGPLVYTSGSSAPSGWYSVSCSSFNGAAGLHQRKRGWLSANDVRRLELQWGRWFTPAEATSW